MTKEIPALRNEERGLFFSMLNSEGKRYFCFPCRGHKTKRIFKRDRK